MASAHRTSGTPVIAASLAAAPSGPVMLRERARISPLSWPVFSSTLVTTSGYQPRTIETSARVHLRIIDGWLTIQQIDLETNVDVPDIDATEFQKRAEEAKTNCILSRALTGVETINLAATLRS